MVTVRNISFPRICRAIRRTHEGQALRSSTQPPQSPLTFLCAPLQASVGSVSHDPTFSSVGRIPLRLLDSFAPQRKLDALRACAPLEWLFTNDWLVLQNESPVPLPGIATKCKQIHSPEFPLGQGQATFCRTWPDHRARLLPCPVLLTLLLFLFLLRTTLP